ncbi:MAG TPA: class I SAM-dependent methyltransferase [Bryobacteraceae bacterium]|nr:class I SAM-dependent methyltransferase [Bryobacteraceae bacterium]
MSQLAYAGRELTLFEKARRWKDYWRGHILPFVHGDVLEVGAGIGANTWALRGLPCRRWVCLEPDPALASQVALPTSRHELFVGTVADLDPRHKFDAILYLDVIEHIEDDRTELGRAAALLAPGGSIIVLAPAHACLYTAFDRAIGHFRRYNTQTLRAIAPPGLRERKLIYLDSCGALASLSNRVLLRSAMPTERQILTWDRFLVPCSRRLDPLLGHKAGKSVLGVWAAA